MAFIETGRQMAMNNGSNAIGNAIELSRETLESALSGLPLRARMIMKALAGFRRGRLHLTLPDGRTMIVNGPERGIEADVTLRNWRLPTRALAAGSVGVAESYMDGDWDSADVTAFLEYFLQNSRDGADFTRGSNRILVTLQKLRHWLNANSKRGSKRNIAAHYDLGNAFYEQWLDPSMTYSSALFEDGANDLESAQTAKYRALAEGMELKRGDHVLEIGCGWGGFAEFAAREFGARVTGLTISREQYDFAKERIARAGLQDRVDFKFQDYRDETGQYDRVASIEMFEAVGEKYWPVYFDKVRQCLKPGGKAGLQIITINDEDFPRYRRQPDFIQRYIFPGGMLPSPSALAATTRRSDLHLVRERIFPQDYARTLAEWRVRFLDAWDDIKPLGFDERFRRLWAFYMHYCEAGFKREFIDVRQMIYR